MIFLFNILAQSSWHVQQPDVENLQDQANRMNDPETDAESDTELEQSADDNQFEDNV